MAEAAEAEVAAWTDERAHLTDDRGRRRVVRKGYVRDMTLSSGGGLLNTQDGPVGRLYSLD